MASRRSDDNGQATRNRQLLDHLLRERSAALMNQARFHSELADDADDAFDEACLAFLRHFGGDDEDHALRYLLVVIKRCAWAISRRRRRRGRVVAIVAAGTLDSMVADQRRGPEQLIEVAEAAADLDAAMRSLKPDQRRALTLLALGYSYAEIAERSGWTRTKVNRSLTEGRARLRGLLDRGGENS